VEMESEPPVLERYPRRDGVYSVLPDAVLVHDRHQNRVIHLDPLCTAIWLRIDGLTTLNDIALDIAGQTNAAFEDVARSTAAMVGAMSAEGLLYLETAPAPLPYHLTVPLDEQDPMRAAESMRASGWV
jgi:hypothetical protein